LAWRPLAHFQIDEESAMNDNMPEIAERVPKVALLPVENQIELEWANALSCGAPGPSREGPVLFYQSAEDWDDRLAICAGK
jgi:hypothetical protein